MSTVDGYKLQQKIAYLKNKFLEICLFCLFNGNWRVELVKISPDAWKTIIGSKEECKNRECGLKKSTLLRTLQRKSHLCIPFVGIVRPQPQFQHSCVCERFIYSPRIGPHISSRRIGRPIVGIYKSLTDAWRLKLGLRPRYSFSGNICFEISVFYLCSVEPLVSHSFTSLRGKTSTRELTHPVDLKHSLSLVNISFGDNVHVLLLAAPFFLLHALQSAPSPSSYVFCSDRKCLLPLPPPHCKWRPGDNPI